MNLRPPRPKRGALPSCATSRKFVYIKLFNVLLCSRDLRTPIMVLLDSNGVQFVDWMGSLLHPENLFILNCLMCYFALGTCAWGTDFAPNRRFNSAVSVLRTPLPLLCSASPKRTKLRFARVCYIPKKIARERLELSTSRV